MSASITEIRLSEVVSDETYEQIDSSQTLVFLILQWTHSDVNHSNRHMNDRLENFLDMLTINVAIPNLIVA